MLTKIQTANAYQDANRIVLEARSELVRMSKYMFFANILYGAKIVVTESLNGEAINTMATDMQNIYCNPFFVLEITKGENKGVLAHETMHIADLHGYRKGTRDHETWNSATDYAINPIILDSGLILPKGGLVDTQYNNMSAEQIYNLLIKQNKQQQQSAHSPAGQPDNKPQSGNQKTYAPGKILKPQENTEQAKSEIKEQVLQAARMCEVGDIVLPSAFSKIVQRTKKPKENWREQLREFASASITKPVYHSWTRINRRMLSTGVYLPGWHKEDAGHLVIVKDTSGSINDAPNAQFDAEIKLIVEDVAPSKVTVIACDNRVRFHHTYHQGEEIHLSSLGGGGTSFAPAIELINNLAEKPSGVIYFTDMGCYNFGSPDNYPVLWAKWGYYENNPPYGKVINITQ